MGPREKFFYGRRKFDASRGAIPRGKIVQRLVVTKLSVKIEMSDGRGPDPLRKMLR